MERNTGLRSVLTVPRVYEVTQAALYRRSAHEERVRALFPGLGSSIRRVLDVGSGPAAFLAQYGRFAAFEYVALDPSAAYIAKAEQRFPGRGRYLVGTTDTVDAESLGTFDLIVCDGVLHHVSDAEAVAIARFARDRLAPGGRFVTFDPVRVPGQHPVAALLMRMDRGARIRTEDAYHALLSEAFGPDTSGTVIHGRLRPPYDHYESVSLAPTTSATT